MYITLTIAYYNLAVEMEYLHEYDGSIFTYERALEVAKKHIGQGATIISTI